MFQIISELHAILTMIKGFNSSYSSENENTMLICKDNNGIYKITIQKISDASDIETLKSFTKKL